MILESLNNMDITISIEEIIAYISDPSCIHENYSPCVRPANERTNISCNRSPLY